MINGRCLCPHDYMTTQTKPGSMRARRMLISRTTVLRVFGSAVVVGQYTAVYTVLTLIYTPYRQVGNRLRHSLPPPQPSLSAVPLTASLDMQSFLTPEWIASLRRDVEKWDKRVRRQGSDDGGMRWRRPRPPRTWLELVPPLKYTGDAAERVRVLQSRQSSSLTLSRSRTIEGEKGGRARGR